MPPKTQRRTSKSPVDRLLGRFIGFLERSEHSPITIRNYVCDVDGFATWFEGSAREGFAPDRITATDLRQFKRHLLVTRELAPASINRKFASLKSFLTWATAAGMVDRDRQPQMPKAEKVPRRGPQWLERKSQNALRRTLDRYGSASDCAVVSLLLNTGLRVGELCALTWSDVAVTARKGMVTVRRGKGGKRRLVPLNPEARNAFRTLGYGSGGARPRDRVLKGQRGALTVRGVQLRLEKYFQLAGLEDASPHTLRHTFCKSLLDAGVSLEKVAALAGHESLETTRIYGEPSLADLAESVALIGEA